MALKQIETGINEGVCLARANNGRRDLVSRLENEGEIKDVGEISVENYERVDELCRFFEKFIFESKKSDHYLRYHFDEETKKYKFSSHEITSFSLNLLKYQDEYYFCCNTGKFLSRLIYLSKENEFLININHLNIFPSYMCRDNKDKKIIINGNCGDELGTWMSGGKIIVNGNCGKEVGIHMFGGEIHINGEYKNIARRYNLGSIYHNGIKIIENGNSTGEGRIKWNY